MAYTPRNWQEGITPLSPTTLNQIEQGLQAAANVADIANALAIQLNNQIQRIEYDDYLTRLEMYYAGHMSNLDVSGFKGMILDGFLNTNLVDMVNTTARIDTTNKWCWGLNKNTLSVRPLTFVNSVVSGYSDNSDFSSPASAIDTDVNTYATGPSTYNTTYQSTVVMDLGSKMMVDLINFTCASSYSSYNGVFGINKVGISTDGVTYTLLSGVSNGSMGGVKATIPIDLGGVRECRYVVVEFFHYMGNAATNYNYLYDVTFRKLGTGACSLYSVMKTLPMTANNVMGIVSVKEAAGATVTAFASLDNGTHYTSLPLTSSRADPLDGSYTEKTFSAAIGTAGSQIIVRFDFTVDDTTLANHAYIKRYGAYWN